MQLSPGLGLFAAAACGLYWWHAHSDERALRREMDAYGFLSVPMPRDASPNVVLVFAPLNCPGEGAQRADKLAQVLTAAGIPNRRTANYTSPEYSSREKLAADSRRMSFVMEGEVPIALLNGRGKANPSADDIIAEYNLTK